jgi:hypothetical protein
LHLCYYYGAPLFKNVWQNEDISIFEKNSKIPISCEGTHVILLSRSIKTMKNDTFSIKKVAFYALFYFSLLQNAFERDII